MGQLAGITKATGQALHQVRRGRSHWAEVFGSTHKEERQRPDFYGTDTNGNHNSWVRGVIANPAAFKRLLQAMRSMAPGGWSDDRWEQSKHFVGIAYVAIHRICLQLQVAEFQVYRRDPKHPDGKVPVTPDDPPEGERDAKPWDLVKLLEHPNNQDSFGKWMYRIGQQKRLTGTGLTWMVPNKLGYPMELYCIPTAIAIPQPAINPDYPDGYYRIQPLYPYGPFSSYPTPATAVGAPIPAQWMIRSQYAHPLLRYEGYAPMTGVRKQIDQLEMVDDSRWYSMKGTVNPSATLDLSEMEGSQPWDDAELERVRAEFENMMQGPQNSGKLLVPPPGGRIEPWGRAPVDMEYQAGWEQIASFILGGGFGITKPAAGMVENSSYANLWATLKQLHLVELDPECSDLSADLTRYLAPFFGDDLIVEIRTKRIDDQDLLLARLNVLIAAKAITKNELRRELEMPLTREPWGKDIAGTDPQPQMPLGAGGGMAPGGGNPMEALQAMAGAGGEGGAGLPPNAGEAAGPQGGPPMEAGGPPQEGGKEQPGRIARGPLGPRKELVGYETKSFYDKVREVCRNGHN